MQSSLLTSPTLEPIPLEDADLSFCPDWLGAEEAGALLQQLQKELHWEQSVIRVYGRRTPIPRLNAWYGDPGCHYQYSGHSLPLHPWPESLQYLRERLWQELAIDSNSVLANLYRDGQDGVGWHSDDEPELGAEPVIASLSLGAPRRFSFRHRRRSDLPVRHLELKPGSLLVMAGATQRHWHHCLPKTRRVAQPRINLTFRRIVDREP